MNIPPKIDVSGSLFEKLFGKTEYGKLKAQTEGMGNLHVLNEFHQDRLAKLFARNHYLFLESSRQLMGLPFSPSGNVQLVLSIGVSPANSSGAIIPFFQSLMPLGHILS